MYRYEVLTIALAMTDLRCKVCEALKVSYRHPTFFFHAQLLEIKSMITCLKGLNLLQLGSIHCFFCHICSTT